MTTQNEASKRAYTVSEVAAILAVNPLTIYRQVERGELDAVRIGRAIRIPETVVSGLLGEVAQ